MDEIVELLNKAQAAERLHIKPVTLDRMLKAGTGPSVTRVGGRIFIQPGHLNAWLASRVVTPIT